MLPLTRANLHMFCRVCLCILMQNSKDESHEIVDELLEKLRVVTDISERNLKNYFICRSCYIKTTTVKIFQDKAIFKSGVLKLLKIKGRSQSVLNNLARLCRLCLKQLNSRINITEEIYAQVFECTGLYLKEKTNDSNNADRLSEESSFPKFICKKCCETLKSFTAFLNIVKKSEGDLQDILDEEEDKERNEAINDNDSYSKPENIRMEELRTCGIDVNLTDDFEEIALQVDQEFSTTICEINFNFVEHYEEIAFKADHEVDFSEEQLSSNTLDDNETDNDSNSVSAKCFFSCEQCMKTFKNNVALNLHVRKEHAFMAKEKSKNICMYCQKGFKRKEHLKDHILAVHKQLRPFPCKICKKSFALKTTLARHEKSHNAVKKYPCKFCKDRFFTSEKELKIHNERHLSNPELVCPICKRAKPNSEELNQHISKHQNSSYQCSTCGKVFAKMFRLKRHESTVHLKIKKYKCDLCEKSYTEQKALKAHKLLHDPTNRPENCNICHLYFKTKRALLTHLKKEHQDNLNVI